MAWWSEASTEPKRKYRFYIEMGSTGKLVSAKSVGKPSVAIDAKEYRLINHFYNYPGVPKWDPITITLVDKGQIGLDPEKANGGLSTSNALWEILLASGYSTPSGDSGVSVRNKTISSPEKASTISNSFGEYLHIYQLDASGKKVEYWKLYNPIMTKISWGDLDYGDDGLVEYTLEVKYDWAVLMNEKGDNEATVETDGSSG